MSDTGIDADDNTHGELGRCHSNRYVFSGKIKCAECGSNFVSKRDRLKDGGFVRRWGCYAAMNYGRKHTDNQGNEIGCNIGKMIRDDEAMEILQHCIQSLQIDMEWIIQNVTTLALAAIRDSSTLADDVENRIQYQIEQLTKKKERVLDAFFSCAISKDDMSMMNGRYNQQLDELHTALTRVRDQNDLGQDEKAFTDQIRNEVRGIAKCDTVSEAFLKNLLDNMMVSKNGLVETHFQFLPHKWTYELHR